MNFLILETTLGIGCSVLRGSYNAIKFAHWYVVHGSDTTMMTIAASLPGQ